MFTKIFFLLLFFSEAALAEYRVYQYYVKNRQPSGIDDEARLVKSSLDPISYLAYHGGSNILKIELLHSWMCGGHTGKRPLCLSPLAQLPRTTDEQTPQKAPEITLPPLP